MIANVSMVLANTWVDQISISEARHNSNILLRFKVFYNDRKCSHGSESIGLDVDATDMYGPETITLRGVESGSFSYYVHIYTNGVCWDKIRANVKVYQASTGGLLYNINQPKCSECK